MLTLNCNNGNNLAEIVHDENLLLNCDTCEQAMQIAESNVVPFNKKWFDNDDFWGDFLYRLEELGYKLNA